MEPLSDPLADRQLKDLMPPPHQPLAEHLLYPNKGTLPVANSAATSAPNWELLKTHLHKEGKVSREHCHKILNDTMALISKNVFLIKFRKGAQPARSA